MDETPRRPWWRMHLLAFACGVVVASAFAVLNVLERSPTSLKALEAGWPFSDELPIDWYRLTRQSIGHVPVDLEPLPQRPKLVASNLAIAVVLVIGSTFTIERRLRTLPGRARFGIKAILVSTACAATFLAVARIRDRLGVLALTDAAIGIVAVAAVLAWVAAFDMLGIVWNRIASMRRDGETPDSDSPASKNTIETVSQTTFRDDGGKSGRETTPRVVPLWPRGGQSNKVIWGLSFMRIRYSLWTMLVAVLGFAGALALYRNDRNASSFKSVSKIVDASGYAEVISDPILAEVVLRIRIDDQWRGGANAPRWIGEIEGIDKTVIIADCDDFDDTWISDLADDHQMVELVVLHVELPDASLSALSRASALRSLHLGGSECGDGAIQFTRDLPALCELNLARTQVTDAGLSFLNARVVSLNLFDTAITDDGMRHLSRHNALHHINLTKTHVTDRGLTSLVGIRELRSLALHGTKVTPQGCQRFNELRKATGLNTVDIRID